METKAKTFKNGRVMALGVLLAVLLFVQFGTVPLYANGNSDTTNRISVINSKEIRDYVCIVNRHLHPNMERYLDTVIRAFIKEGNSNSDDYARMMEGIKRGGSGSGFVYVDRKGNNYIITNYHVIVGAYRFSVTFENDNGDKTVYKNLSVLNVNEAADLAILAFPDGQKPFKGGIPISGTQLRSGSRVHAAGYPGGISDTPTWNLTEGSVANAGVIPSGQEYKFIQHSAAINPGNSGGPLLAEDKKSHVGYSVVGVNTMYLNDIFAGYLAIPLERVEAFLRGSFEQPDEIVALNNRIAVFMELLEKSTTNVPVYKDISSFLSSTMINANPIKALEDLPDNSSDIGKKVVEDPVVGIAWAVAYNQIENSVYRKSRRPLAQKVLPELISVEPNNTGSYTSRLLVNGYPFRAEWIKDYGTWKLDSFYEDDGEYNDFSSLATPHPLGKKVIYSLSSERDYDWYTLNIPRPGKLTVRTEGNIDAELDLFYDPSITANRERPLDSNDDYSGRGVNALVSADVRAGTVYVLVRLADGSSGEYILLAGLDNELADIQDTATVTTYSGPSITIVNNTMFSVDMVNISPTTSDSWGGNLLTSNQILRNGQSVSLQLPYPISQVSRYDIRLVDTDDDMYIKENVQVTANSRIEFTFSDFVGARR